jgi:arylformamidase
MPRIDISMPLFEGMPAFPGDPLFASRPVHSLARGDAYSVSALSIGSHAGTHVDPPCHFISGGATVDRLDLDQLNGPCRVIEVRPDVRLIGPEEVAGIPPGTARVLFRTANSPRWQRSLEFFSDYVALGEGGARSLLERGIRVVGIDSLSVESDPSGRFPVHHLLLGRATLIVEGLLLGHVAPGEYEFQCLPLNLRGGDGGPARAVLIPP